MAENHITDPLGSKKCRWLTPTQRWVNQLFSTDTSVGVGPRESVFIVSWIENNKWQSLFIMWQKSICSKEEENKHKQ